MFARSSLRQISLFGATSRFYATGAGRCLVLAEHNNKTLHSSTLSAITAARALGEDITLLVLGSDCKGVVDEAATVEGVKRVMYNDNQSFHRPLPESIAPVLQACQKEHNFSHVLSPATANGKNILPRFSALLDSQQISDVIQIESEDTFVRPIYAGTLPRRSLLPDHVSNRADG